MRFTRRRFLGTAAAVGAGFWGLRQLLDGADTGPTDKSPYGPLISDPYKIIDLPKRFSYQIISRIGDQMADGLRVPGLPDGMATFAGAEDLTVLLRNHELTPKDAGPFGKNAELLDTVDEDRLYDVPSRKKPCIGGTTTVVFNTKTQKVVRQFLSLGGTIRNCAGGATPWGSWVTCEETVVRVGGDKKAGYDAHKDHGFNFEVPATIRPRLTPAVPLKDMGRFNHEAIAVDPSSRVVYQTEDRPDGLIYRFLPKRPGKLADGGRLQALRIQGQPSLDTRNWKEQTVPVGRKLTVEWIDMEDVLSPNDDLRHRGFKAGAARFARGEGMWAGDGEIYFACTNGGKAEAGQIWRYIPSAKEGEPGAKGELELFIEPNDSRLLKSADNLTISPWGDLVVCEDRGGAVVRIIGVTPKGHPYTFANTPTKSEFAGATFSPDGSTLFVNIQKRGLTLAITGPFLGATT